MTRTDLCVNKPPTTSLFWKGHQDASRMLEKMCWLWGEYVEDWHVQVSVWKLWFKKKNQSRSYLNHLVFFQNWGVLHSSWGISTHSDSGNFVSSSKAAVLEPPMCWALWAVVQFSYKVL
jgi:hypothetical protein